MVRRIGLTGLAGLCLIGVLFSLGAFSASAQGEHGIGFSKGCDTPTKIGDPYVCSYTIRNNSDDFGDDLTATSLIDNVFAFDGTKTSTNIIHDGALVLLTAPGTGVCTGGTGSGTLADPWVNSTQCLLHDGARIQAVDFHFYTVRPGDYTANAAHLLTDTATLTWQDLCTSGAPNCPVGNQTATAGSSTTVVQLVSTTATDIHNAAHQVVTAVGVGTNVHDFVTVTGEPGRPTPTGNVTVDWFLNGTCTGAPTATSGNFALNAAGQVDASSFNFTVNAAGHRAFKAHYAGDGTYAPSDGACEPLTVVDANIQITPNGVNPVGTTHTFTAHVNVNDGNGFTNAPDGTQISFTIDSGPGSFTTPNPCTTTGGTGSCTITLTSAVTGTTVVSAHTTLSVGGVTLTRNTDGTDSNSGPAQKVWVNANIQITPANATNAVGTNHVLTITVNALNGTIDAGPHTATATIVSGPGSFVGPNTCTYTGGAATASCTVTITSAVVGTTVVQATSDIPVSGVTITRTTGTAANTAAGGSDNANKVWVNANIQITPATATNPVGTNHVLTITVNALGGTIDAGPHTATASIVSGPGSFVGSPTCTYVGGGTTAFCQVTITSNAVGTTVVSATSNIPVNGQSITRTTGTAVNTAAGGSDNANKVWGNANIQISPATATNPIGTNHVLTITVNAIGGNIDAGPHTATATIVSGPGSFVGPNTCTYTGGGPTASCTVTITSATVGTTVVQATSDIPVNGNVITRTTGTAVNTAAGGSGNAQKSWVDANISISPSTANNPVGSNHVLTITVNALGGTIDAGPHTATASIVSGPGSFVGSPTCTYTGGAATASCTVTITSATAGTTVVSATSDIPVNGVTITRTTGTAANTASGGSGNASKNWGDVTNVTHVRDAANNDITNKTVDVGTVVHDEATVTRTAGTPAAVPNPTGTVDFTLYSGGSCNGAVVATDAGKPLNASGLATSATFTTPQTAGAFSYRAHYNGDANYPAKDADCEPFSTKTTPTGLIAPTQVTCSDVLNGTAAVLGQINYSLSGGVIGQGINPGVFFFYSKITTTTPNQVVTVTQTNTSTNNTPNFGIQNGQAWLWSGDCTSKLVGTVTGANSGNASFTVPVPGNYIIGIKYQTKSIAGAPGPVPADITYNFATSLGGQTGASVLLKKQ